MDMLATLPVSLRQLQYIVAVADRGSFRRAAEACFVAQPSLSAQVAVAERALGVQLFERTGRRVRVPRTAGCSRMDVASTKTATGATCTTASRDAWPRARGP